MGRPLFNSVVVLFWLSTMGWLLVEKVLPPLKIGQPPDYQSVLTETDSPDVTAWDIRWEDQVLGWSGSKIIRKPDGMRELHSRVFFRHLPVQEMTPAWLATLLGNALKGQRIEMDVRSSLQVDPLGRLGGFDSRVRIADMRDAIKLRGIVEGDELEVVVQCGEVVSKTRSFLAPGALVSDALAPQGRLPGLKVGQTWTTPVYSPFHAPNSPMEILQARVERTEFIAWNDQSLEALLVVYRGQGGSGLFSGGEPGRVWVRPDDGLVLQQEITIFPSTLVFTRLPDDKAEQLSVAVNENWLSDQYGDQARELFDKIIER